MNETLAAAEAYLIAGDLEKAWVAFDSLRPNVRFGFQGLELSTRIHFAAKRWPEVSVLCRVLRKEYPTCIAGYLLEAESLHAQGRTSEAIELLKTHLAPNEAQLLAAMERFQTSGSRKVSI